MHPEALQNFFAELAVHARVDRALPCRIKVLVDAPEGVARTGITLITHHQHVGQPQRLNRFPESFCRLPGHTLEVGGHLLQLGGALGVRLNGSQLLAKGAVPIGQVARQGGSGQHGAQLRALGTFLLRSRKRCIVGLKIGVDPFPAALDDRGIIRDQVAAGGAGVAVAVVVQPEHGRPAAVGTVHQRVALPGFALGKAGRGQDVEPPTCHQIAWEDLLGQVMDHHLSNEPGTALGQAPFPEGLWKIHHAGNLAERGTEGLQKGIRFRNDVKGKLVELEIPGCAGGPGGELVIPGAVQALEVVISQPLDARGKVAGHLDLVTGSIRSAHTALQTQHVELVALV